SGEGQPSGEDESSGEDKPPGEGQLSVPTAKAGGHRRRNGGAAYAKTVEEIALGKARPEVEAFEDQSSCEDQPAGPAAEADSHRQRPRHRPPADSEDIREAPVRVQVPSVAHEPRTAGYRDLSRWHVRADDNRQIRPDYLPHGSKDAGPLL